MSVQHVYGSDVGRVACTSFEYALNNHQTQSAGMNIPARQSLSLTLDPHHLEYLCGVTSDEITKGMSVDEVIDFNDLRTTGKTMVKLSCGKWAPKFVEVMFDYIMQEKGLILSHPPFEELVEGAVVECVHHFHLFLWLGYLYPPVHAWWRDNLTLYENMEFVDVKTSKSDLLSEILHYGVGTNQNCARPSCAVLKARMGSGKTEMIIALVFQLFERSKECEADPFYSIHYNPNLIHPNRNPVLIVTPTQIERDKMAADFYELASTSIYFNAMSMYKHDAEERLSRTDKETRIRNAYVIFACAASIDKLFCEDGTEDREVESAIDTTTYQRVEPFGARSVMMTPALFVITESLEVMGQFASDFFGARKSTMTDVLYTFGRTCQHLILEGADADDVLLHFGVMMKGLVHTRLFWAYASPRFGDKTITVHKDKKLWALELHSALARPDSLIVISCDSVNRLHSIVDYASTLMSRELIFVLTHQDMTSEKASLLEDPAAVFRTGYRVFAHSPKMNRGLSDSETNVTHHFAYITGHTTKPTTMPQMLHRHRKSGNVHVLFENHCSSRDKVYCRLDSSKFLEESVEHVKKCIDWRDVYTRFGNINVNVRPLATIDSVYLSSVNDAWRATHSRMNIDYAFCRCGVPYVTSYVQGWCPNCLCEYDVRTFDKFICSTDNIFFTLSSVPTPQYLDDDSKDYYPLSGRVVMKPAVMAFPCAVRGYTISPLELVEVLHRYIDNSFKIFRFPRRFLDACKSEMWKVAVYDGTPSATNVNEDELNEFLKTLRRSQSNPGTAKLVSMMNSLPEDATMNEAHHEESATKFTLEKIASYLSAFSLPVELDVLKSMEGRVWPFKDDGTTFLSGLNEVCGVHNELSDTSIVRSERLLEVFTFTDKYTASPRLCTLPDQVEEYQMWFVLYLFHLFGICVSYEPWSGDEVALPFTDVNVRVTIPGEKWDKPLTELLPLYHVDHLSNHIETGAFKAFTDKSATGSNLSDLARMLKVAVNKSLNVNHLVRIESPKKRHNGRLRNGVLFFNKPLVEPRLQIIFARGVKPTVRPLLAETMKGIDPAHWILDDLWKIAQPCDRNVRPRTQSPTSVVDVHVRTCPFVDVECGVDVD